MDVILNESETETVSLKFDSDEDEMECDSTPLSEDKYFLDDDTCYEEDIEHGPSFYRTFDNREIFSNFENQIKNPVESSERPEKNYYGEDDLPELFAPENRKTVNCHSFSNDKNRALDFKRSLRCFVPKQENQFFYAVVYGLYQKIKDAPPITKVLVEDAEKILGKTFYFELQKIKQDVMLNYTFFGFFNRCKLMNRVLAEFGFF